MGEVLSAARVRRLQPDVLPAVHPWVHGDAAALSRVSARVSGAERALYRRCVDPGIGLSTAHGLFDMVTEVRQDRWSESVGSGRARMADPVAASYGELPDHAGCHGRDLSLFERGEGICLTLT